VLASCVKSAEVKNYCGLPLATLCARKLSRFSGGSDRSRASLFGNAQRLDVQLMGQNGRNSRTPLLRPQEPSSESYRALGLSGGINLALVGIVDASL